jgi:RNA polymerase-binding transcription factor DksA
MTASLPLRSLFVTERVDVFDAVELELRDVELALARLDAGTYSRCEACDTPLDLDVLTSAPTVRRCPRC